MKKQGEFLQKAFEKLRKKARRLQKVLGTAYDSDEMLCDFYRRALQDELFWAFVLDWEYGTTAEKLCGRIHNAIVKYERTASTSGRRTETWNTSCGKRKNRSMDSQKAASTGSKPMPSITSKKWV